jgi:hypothetical protein
MKIYTFLKNWSGIHKLKSKPLEGSGYSKEGFEKDFEVLVD